MCQEWRPHFNVESAQTAVDYYYYYYYFFNPFIFIIIIIKRKFV